MKKYLGVTIAVVIALLGAYQLGLHKQCTTINLNNDYSFTCDGRKIQGPTYAKEWPTQIWEYHNYTK